MESDTYFNQVGSIIAPTELDSEIPILPRMLRDGHGDLFFVTGEKSDPQLTSEEKARARALFKEIGVDLPE